MNMAENKAETASKPKVKKKVTKSTKPAAPKKKKPKTAEAKPVAAKKSTRVQDIPSGLRESSVKGNSNLDSSIVHNKAKVKRKRKKKKANGEKIFWIIIGLIVVAVMAVGIMYIFQDYSNDRSTPTQLNTPKISKGDIEYVENIALDNALVEKIEVTDQGPIIYVIYTTPAGTPREDIKNVISEGYKNAFAEKPEMFETYSFQITVIASGEEAEGVNDYPVIGSMNTGTTGVSWMANDGHFVDPKAEEKTD